MANTRNLQQSVIWTGAYINYLPLLQGSQEPAVSNANMVLQTILGPPFAWRWNRNTTNFNCLAPAGNPSLPTQDYSLYLPDFGFIETAWVKNADGTGLKQMQLEGPLSATVEIARPGLIAAMKDDNQGNITFRLSPAPDQAYVVAMDYQKKSPLMTSIASLWVPVPDEMAYIYDWGFLALGAIVAKDERFPIFNQKFISHLLGAQEGLTEMQRNIFLGNWLGITKELIAAQGKTNQGLQARAN